MNNFNVKISQQSEITSSKSFSISGDGSSIIMQRTIYNNLKSIIKNTDVKITNDDTGNGYENFLESMSLLHDKEILGLDVDVPIGTEDVDEYLGLLGLSENYQMKKDIIRLSKFLNADYTAYEGETNG